MSLHDRDCDYCGRMTQWRSTDPVPQKCPSCGAPPCRARAKNIEIAYELQCMNLHAQAQLQRAQMRQDLSSNRLSMANWLGGIYAQQGLWR
jgi:hypothetical protein